MTELLTAVTTTLANSQRFLFIDRPAIVVLLMSMVNEKQPFVLRCAVLYCFQCYLFRNQQGQAAVVQTLLPSQTVEGREKHGRVAVERRWNDSRM